MKFTVLTAIYFQPIFQIASDLLKWDFGSNGIFNEGVVVMKTKKCATHCFKKVLYKNISIFAQM